MGALGRNLQCVLCYAEKLLKHLNTCFLFSVQAFLDVVKRICFLLLYMMISVPSFVAHHKVRGAIFQCFLSFYVANLLFVLWGVVNG